MYAVIFHINRTSLERHHFEFTRKREKEKSSYVFRIVSVGRDKRESTVNFHTNTHAMSYSKGSAYKVLGKYERTLLRPPVLSNRMVAVRYLSVLPFLGRILRLRYLFLGGAIGGGVAINNVCSHCFSVFLLLRKSRILIFNLYYSRKIFICGKKNRRK